MTLKVTRDQALAFRLRANGLHRRLRAGALAEAARFGLQDTYPRSALLSLHARVEDVGSEDWADSSIAQVWSPRTAVYVVPAQVVGIFTVGRQSRDRHRQRAVVEAAGLVSRALGGAVLLKRELWHKLGQARPEVPFLAAQTGRFLLRWDARDTLVWEVPEPDLEAEGARLELCRRHLGAFGPSTAAVFARWAGVERADALETWHRLESELVEVDFEGQRAFVLEEDVRALQRSAPITGVRFLPAEEKALLGRDRARLFAAPEHRGAWPPFDSHHPHALMVDGRLQGAWGRRQGRVEVLSAGPLTRAERDAVEAEALVMPIPNATMSVVIRRV